MTEIEKEYPNFFKNSVITTYPGWNDLIREMLSKIIELFKTSNDIKKYDIEFTKIQERFGKLQINYKLSGNLLSNNKGIADKILETIIEAEKKSSNICEICGEHGSMMSTSWIKCLCEKHKLEYDLITNGYLKYNPKKQ